MWIVYALAASVIWGISYAASGRVIERGVSPLVFFTCYALFGGLTGSIALAAMGKLAGATQELRHLEGDLGWFVLAIITSGVGALLIYIAIGEKNATLASLIEISYPFFVAIFAWIFFRETQFNLPTVLGGILIMMGVGIVFLGNRH